MVPKFKDLESNILKDKARNLLNSLLCYLCIFTVQRYRTQAMANRGYNYLFQKQWSGYYSKAVMNRMRSLLLNIFLSPCQNVLTTSRLFLQLLTTYLCN